MQELSALDLAGVEPTAHALDLTNQVRPDARPAVVAARRGAAKRPRPGRRRLPRAPDGMTDTLGLSAERCVALLDAREVSCRELASAYLDRIDAGDAAVHAFLRTRREAALAEADRFDRDGRTGLQGVPIALKDILCTKGEETTAGSRILEGYVPIYDGGCVTRVRRRGSSTLGKTNMDEFAMGSSTENSAFGVPTTRGTPTASRAARRAARPRPSPPASRRSRSAPTPAARSASRPRSAASSG